MVGNAATAGRTATHAQSEATQKRKHDFKFNMGRDHRELICRNQLNKFTPMLMLQRPMPALTDGNKRLTTAVTALRMDKSLTNSFGKRRVGCAVIASLNHSRKLPAIVVRTRHK